MYDELERIAHDEFADVITGTRVLGRRAGVGLKLRITITDGTFLDVWVSTDSTRYSYHWEQRARRGAIHRFDNAPDHPEIATFPKHVHEGSEGMVRESDLPDDPRDALRAVLEFVRTALSSLEST